MTSHEARHSVGWTITAREHAPSPRSRPPTGRRRQTPKGEPRPLDEAAGAEITGLLPAATLAGYPTGTRVTVRRERPHPGAQLDAIEERDGYRYTAHATDTRTGQHAWLDAATAPTPGSKTASAPDAPPAWEGCPADPSRSTRRG